MSSSDELSTTSVVVSPPELSGERLVNLKQKAAEAARHPFLWELGLRAESPSQVPQICQRLLGVSNEDEKLVKAVAVLRRSAPQVLEEIGGGATSGGSKAMQVIRGRRHFELMSHDKDRNLWVSISRQLNYSLYETEQRNVTGNPPTHGDTDIINVRSNKCDDSSGVFGLILHHSGPFRQIEGTSMTVRVFDGRDTTHDLKSIGYRHMIGYQYLVEIWPSIFNEGSREPESMSVLRGEPSFYKSGCYFAAVISVTKPGFLPLAKKIANAYEQATKRRKKPARAFILKDY